MNSIAYVTVDVFTSERFSGNQLAVIPDARGLSERQMQAIAAEFRYSEVTFVLPPQDHANTALVRIFTPTMEIPFAGHPNVGTAFALGNQTDIFGKAVGDMLRFEEKAGIVEARLTRDSDGRVTSASIEAPQALSVGPEVDLETIARCASLDVAAIRTATHTPVIASVGLPFAIAELADLDALGKACPNTAAFAEAGREYSPDDDQFALFLYTRSLENPWRLRARMFAPLDNVIEDPATGSAAGALGALLTSLMPESDTVIDITIEQGIEMGRRSVIGITAEKSDGRVHTVRISGSCATVMSGTLLL
ncbi:MULTISPECIES: PhzF family phenazine biosynthesis protein [unclassified Rhizobium]|uniref:PhzF family phenazine biosynthesis protein n=1 Tax=unclassified Rhizobium TaxID=2613769 RepID=UPI000712F53A|nr:MULTISPECIES: PhzF family phenazine biosynthesis protein [unclassified Rhizobium]KQS84216.1 PhzF family phenazine biosynthesis protein [Rhizobium sp. Leaf386]KQT00842.1 PhzF family phenazine biosynthesis protein [Rhizobium sp. Leaf391]KQU08491.1 PhzF family phenazine biosynthesis protein [Rhizobium sp. Leaf453]